jgi:hypothetical protein
VRPDAHCRSCGAPIRWAVHVATHKRMPIDAEAIASGNLGVVEWVEGPTGEVFDSDGHVVDRVAFATPVVAVNPTAGSAQTPYRYTSHFATCPQADQWRRSR